MSDTNPHPLNRCFVGLDKRLFGRFSPINSADEVKPFWVILAVLVFTLDTGCSNSDNTNDFRHRLATPSPSLSANIETELQKPFLEISVTTDGSPLPTELLGYINLRIFSMQVGQPDTLRSVGIEAHTPAFDEITMASQSGPLVAGFEGKQMFFRQFGMPPGEHLIFVCGSGPERILYTWKKFAISEASSTRGQIAIPVASFGRVRAALPPHWPEATVGDQSKDQSGVIAHIVVTPLGDAVDQRQSLEIPAFPLYTYSKTISFQIPAGRYQISCGEFSDHIYVKSGDEIEALLTRSGSAPRREQELMDWKGSM